jgi:hypothetical protein
MKEVVWCFLYVKETTSTENYKAAFELWRKRNPILRTNMDAKLLLNQNTFKIESVSDVRSKHRAVIEGFGGGGGAGGSNGIHHKYSQVLNKCLWRHCSG